MVKKEAPIDYQQKQGPIPPGHFLLFRADSDEEVWLLVVRQSEDLIYLRQRPLTGWPIWNPFGRKINLGNVGPTSRHNEIRSWHGTLDGALAGLRAVGVEERHLEIHRRRGEWADTKPTVRKKKDID